MDGLLTSLQRTQTIALVAGLLVLFLLESVHPFYDFFRGSFRERGRHALRNLLLGGLNAALVALVFVALWLWASTWAHENRVGVLHWLNDALALPLWAHAIGAIILMDAWTYLWHRLNHVIPFFWRFHRVHHSDRNLDVTTASRFHVGEIFFSSLLRIPLIVVLGVHLWELVLYETMMFAIVQFHHANVGLPERVDRALRVVIVTPFMHKVHHSRRRPETDSNFSSLFSIWDRVGHSFRLSPDLRNLRVGLDDFDQDNDQTVRGMLRTPLASAERSSDDQI